MPRLDALAPCLLVLALSIDAALAQAPAVTTDFGLRLSAGSTDNIFQATANEESASYKALGLYFSTRRNGPRLTANLAGDVEVRDYSQANADNEPIGSVNAFVGIDVVPDIFTWVFDDSYGQGRVDPFRATGPNNRQEINVFSTGPRVNLPLGTRTFVRLSATDSRRRFDNTGNLDSDSSVQELGFFRALNTTTEVGLSLTSRDITYDSSPLSWKVDSILLSYQRQLASGAATVRVGESTIDFGLIDTSSPVVDLSWARRLGSRSQFSVTASRSQVDPGDGFLRANVIGNPGAIGAANVFLGAGVYELTDVGIANTMTYERSRISYGLNIGESEYLNNTDLNNDDRRIFFTADRDISQRTTIGLTANIYEREFIRLGVEDVDRNLQLWLQRSFGRRLSLQFAHQRDSRGGQTNFPYDENTYLMTLRLDLNP